MERVLLDRFEKAAKEGEKLPGESPAALAKYVALLQQGIAVQMSGGVRREELLAAIDLAMKAWPE